MPNKTPQDRYEARNIIRVVTKLNRATDVDILTKLAAVPNKQGYIKQLIRKDIAANTTENK